MRRRQASAIIGLVRLRLALLGAGLLVMSALAPASDAGGALRFLSLYTAYPMSCGTDHAPAHQWQAIPNPRAHDLYIRRARIELGMDWPGLGDVWAFVTDTTGAVIIGGNHERYTLPNAPQAILADYGTHYLYVPAGQSFWVDAGCVRLPTSASTNGYVHVWLWYTVGP